MANQSKRNGPRNAREGTDAAALRLPEAAARIGASQSLLKKWRNKAPDDPGEKGPPFIRITPRLVVYKVSDLDAWLDSHAKRASQESAAA